eukprot:2610508-Pleurochrysis_carterae.AAC.2
MSNWKRWPLGRDTRMPSGSFALNGQDEGSVLKLAVLFVTVGGASEPSDAGGGARQSRLRALSGATPAHSHAGAAAGPRYF